jgi:hypothetical protein
MCFRRRWLLSSALAALLLASVACGRKKSPQPPILMVPARTLDLAVQQRGSEMLLRFTYPLTTAAGTSLGPVQSVELWELLQEVPVSTFVVKSEEGEATAAAQGEGAAAEGGESTAPGESTEGTATPAEGAAGQATAEPEAEATEPEAEATEPAAEASAAGATAGAGEETAPSVTLERIRDDELELPAGMTRLEDLVPVDPSEFAATATSLLTLEGPELESAVSGDKIQIRITLADIGTRDHLPVHSFAVKTTSANGLVSAYSNLAWIVRRDPPPAPTHFAVTPQADGIELDWTYAGKGPASAQPPTTPLVTATTPATSSPLAPAELATAPPASPPPAAAAPVDDSGIEAFNVYRRDANSPTYDQPLRRLEKTERTFVDRTAAFGQSYVYAVTAVLRSGPTVESALSTEREVAYDDRFPPPPPHNVVTFVEARSVRLLWDASDASDVAGYFVERQIGDGDWIALQQEPLTGLEYTDRAVVSGQRYRYRVSAIDQTEHRGEPSQSVEVRIP